MFEKSKKRTAGLSVALVSLVAACLLAMSIPAHAVSVSVDGEIGVQNPNSFSYDVTYNTTGTEWFVSEHSHPNVWNTSGTTNTTDPYFIRNDSNGVPYVVELTSFTYASADVDGQDPATVAALTLNLTGDLARDNVDIIDLSSPLSGSVTYTAPLNPGAANQWNYGFTGSYTAMLSTTVLNPLYVMELSFTL